MIINMSRRILNISKPFFRFSLATLVTEPQHFRNKFYHQLFNSLSVKKDNPYNSLKKMIFTLDNMYKLPIIQKNQIQAQPKAQQQLDKTQSVEQQQQQKIATYRQFFQQTNKEILQAQSLQNMTTQQKSEFLIYYLNCVKVWLINEIQQEQIVQFNQFIQQFVDNEIWTETRNTIKQKIENQELSFFEKHSIAAYICFLDEEYRQKAIKQIPFRKLKKNYIMIFICDAVLNNYKLTYEVANQIYSNEAFLLEQQIDLAYEKLKFVQHYSYLLHQSPQLMNFSLVSKRYTNLDFQSVSYKQLKKMIEIISWQASIDNTDYTRKSICGSLSFTLKLVNDRYYDLNPNKAKQLFEIYNQISNIAHIGSELFQKLIPFIQFLEMNTTNLPLIKSCYRHILNSFKPVYKVDRTDTMNKNITKESFEILHSFNNRILDCGQMQYSALILQMGNLKILYPNDNVLIKFAEKYQSHLQSLIKGSTNLMESNFKQFQMILHFCCQNCSYLKITEECLEILKKQITNNQLSKLNLSEQSKILHNLIQIESLNSTSQLFYSSLIDKIIIEQINKQLKTQILINTQKSYYNYFCFTLHNFCKKFPTSSKTPQYKAKLLNFINKKFIYSIKITKKQDHPFLFDTLKYLEFHNLDENVIASYFQSFCSFIAYSCENEEYYIIPEPRKNFYHDVVNYALTKNVTDTIMKIQKKSRIQMLQNLAQGISKNLPMQQLSQYKCQLIRIFKHPNSLNQMFVSSLSTVEFTQDQLRQVEPQVLQNFEYLNPMIADYLKKTGFQVSGTQIKLSANIAKELEYLEESEIKTIFKNKQIYQFLLKSTHFNPQTISKIPQPTNLTKQYQSIEYMYICLRIFSIIKNYQMKLSGRFNTQYAGTSNLQIFDTFLNHKTQLTALIPEIQNIKSKFENHEDTSMADFYLNEKTNSITRNKKPQVWKNYDHPQSIPITDSVFEEETIYCVYENIVKAFYKKSLNLREVFQQYSFHSSIALQVLKLNYQYEITGSCLQILKQNEQESKIILICYNPQNYKIHYLCGYLLYMKGFKVGLINRNAKDSQISNFLKFAFGDNTEKK